MAKTDGNLKAAFAGESQANRKYLAFAKKAENEGKTGLAKIFRAAAEGETVHALSHFGVLGEVKESADNLKAAIFGETYEIETMYPQFVADSKEESDDEATMSFSRALKVEEVHRSLFKDALTRLESGEDVLDVDYYVCQVCGYPASPSAPDICPVCGAKKDNFKKV